MLLRHAAGLAALVLVPAMLAVGAGESARAAGPSAAGTPHYSATITRTTHGIPHIVAKRLRLARVRPGYATAETSICTLADTLLTGRGERSRYLGPDAATTTASRIDGTNLQSRRPGHRPAQPQGRRELLADPKAGPGHAGARRWSPATPPGVEQVPARHRRPRITDPACKGAAWIQPDATALDIWYGVYLANLIASTGNFLKEIVDATRRR